MNSNNNNNNNNNGNNTDNDIPIISTNTTIPKKVNPIKFTQSSTSKYLNDDDDDDDENCHKDKNESDDDGVVIHDNSFNQYINHHLNNNSNYNNNNHHNNHNNNHHNHHSNQHNDRLSGATFTNKQVNNNNISSFIGMSSLTLNFMKKQGFTFKQHDSSNSRSAKKEDESSGIERLDVSLKDGDDVEADEVKAEVDQLVINSPVIAAVDPPKEVSKPKPIDYDDEEGYIDPPFDFGGPKFSRGGIGYDDRLPYPFVKQKHREETTEFEHKQILSWIKTADNEHQLLNSNTSDLEQYLVIGDDDELPPRDEFCSYEKIEELEDKKSTLTDLDRNCFVKARARSNPYEMIKGAIFQNRAAVKMANLDKIASLIEIKPNQEKFYFADVCAGPGGFTEYTLWRMVGRGIPQKWKDQRKKYKTKGWGFTLKGECDWKLDKFTEDSGLKIGENFEVDYGPAKDGDILNEQNIRHFTQKVLAGTGQKGVNLFMADGGISTEGDELNQESILGHLILCQFLTMFEILSQGGNFVCKIFDTFTPFTVGLLYIIFKHFESFTIVKPFTSRPLNSERYVIAKNLLVYRPNKIRNYLYKLNQKLNDGDNIIRIIDIKDPVFINFIKMKSLEQCDSQIRAFEYFTKAVEDWEYRVCDQDMLKQNCLVEWGIPLDPRYHDKSNNKHHHPYNQQQRNKSNNNKKNNNNDIGSTSTSTSTSSSTSTTPVTSPLRKGQQGPTQGQSLSQQGTPQISYVKSPSKQFVSSLDAITKHKIKPFTVIGNKIPPLPSIDSESDFQNL